MPPNARMIATRIAPVAMALARSAIATFPPLRRSPIMPEPTTVARRSAVPSASAVSLRTRVITFDSLRTAGRLAAGAWFRRTHKRTHELAVDLRSNRVNVQSLAAKEGAGVVNAINARGFHVNVLEAGSAELPPILVFF